MTDFEINVAFNLTFAEDEVIDFDDLEDEVIDFDDLEDEDYDDYDDYDECGFDPYMGCYSFDC